MSIFAPPPPAAQRTRRYPVEWVHFTRAGGVSDYVRWDVFDTGSELNLYPYAPFGNAALQTDVSYAFFQAPADIVAASTPSLEFWVVSGGGSGGNARMTLTATNLAADDPADEAGTSTAVLIAMSAIQHRVSIMATVSLGIAVSAGNFIRLSLSRDGAHADDTYDSNVRLMKCAALAYTADS